MGWIEDRMGRLERREEDDYRRLLDLQAQLNAVRQQLRGAYQQLPTGTSSGAGAGYFGATLSATLTHGAPGPALTGQTVWQLAGGARSIVTNAGVLYNDTPNDIASASQVLLAPNSDGTWTAIGVPC